VRQIEPFGAPGHAKEPLEEEPRPAADLEKVSAGGVSGGEIDLQVVDELVVPSGIVRTA
jgi:hypothetical protein